MKIIVYGAGCARCKKTKSIVLQAIAESGVAAEVVQVDNFKDIAKAGVLSTPAVAVDGVIRITGRIPSLKEVKTWINV